ncbi:MAG: glycosyltransferase family 2 protein [Phycisphaerales bacterium]|nr:glycosyltransferase family 2 protein [Phycisphaerales bacterium]
MRPLVSVIIVTYYSRSTIRRCIDALRSSVDAGIARCIVVDNASDDGTAEEVEASFPWVTLVRSPHNLGYGRGCNLGFQRCDTKYVMILNPDTVLSREAIQTLCEFMEAHPSCGIAAPAILEDNSHLQAAGLMTTPWTVLRAAMGSRQAYTRRRVIMPGEEAFRTNWVCGAAMLITSDLFRSLGGFDPCFFLYFEETDLCRRATSAGAEIWAVGAASISHVGGASAEATGAARVGSCIAAYYFPSRYYYLKKHFGVAAAAMTELLETIALRTRGLLRYILRGKALNEQLRRPPLFQSPKCPSPKA